MIIKIDASAIAKSSCFLRFKRIVLDGYCETKLSSDLVYGSAFHKFAEVLTSSKDRYKAVAAGHTLFKREEPNFIVREKKEWLNITHLTNTMIEFSETYGDDRSKDSFQPLRNSEGVALVEQKFAIPLYKQGDIEVLLCGTIDEIGKFRDGCVAIKDYKTTSKNPATFFGGFKLKPQLMTYLYAFKKLAEIYPEGMFGELLASSGRIGCFIEGVFLSSKKETPVTFAKSPVFFFDEQIMKEYEESLLSLAASIANTAVLRKAGVDYTLRDGILNSSCEWCSFAIACSCPDSSAQEIILKNYFAQKPYDPMKIGE